MVLPAGTIDRESATSCLGWTLSQRTRSGINDPAAKNNTISIFKSNLYRDGIQEASLAGGKPWNITQIK